MASSTLTAAPPDKPAMLRRAEDLARSVPDRADIVLVGDSLAASWSPDLLEEATGRAVFRFAVPGERVQHTLWRLATIPTAHLRPRDCVIVLGTNNLGDGDAPERIADGLASVVATMRALWGEPRVLLLTLPWRAERPTFTEADRLRLNGVLLPGLATRLDVTLVDVDSILGTGPETPSLLPDLLHLSPAGYAALTGALAASLAGADFRAATR